MTTHCVSTPGFSSYVFWKTWAQTASLAVLTQTALEWETQKIPIAYLINKQAAKKEHTSWRISSVSVLGVCERTIFLNSSSSAVLSLRKVTGNVETHGKLTSAAFDMTGRAAQAEQADVWKAAGLATASLGQGCTRTCLKAAATSTNKIKNQSPILRHEQNTVEPRISEHLCLDQPASVWMILFVGIIDASMMYQNNGFIAPFPDVSWCSYTELYMWQLACLDNQGFG